MKLDKGALSQTRGESAGHGNSHAKKPYRRPSLAIYGSVRELTGSGTGGAADANMPML